VTIFAPREPTRLPTRAIFPDMSESKRVVCGKHGETPPTFACWHVTRGIACGFHASSEHPDERWPDAWCDLCEEAFQAAGGEWNDVSERQAAVQMMCTHCCETARDRNQRVPPLARGAAARLTAEASSALIRHAVHAGQAIQEVANGRWGWRGMARWDFDDKTSTLTFSDPRRPNLIADVRLVGSYSTRSGTFQWAWQTFDEAAPDAEAVSRLRVFGEVRGISHLTTPKIECDESHGWEMAALAGYILGAEGLYRAPIDHQRWFMLLSNWRVVN
jgi:hypothetical protein